MYFCYTTITPLLLIPDLVKEVRLKMPLVTIPNDIINMIMSYVPPARSAVLMQAVIAAWLTDFASTADTFTAWFVERQNQERALMQACVYSMACALREVHSLDPFASSAPSEFRLTHYN